MYDKHYVGLNLTGFEDRGLTRPISRVTLFVDDENVISAGDDTGYELTADCPHATQAMANAILARVKGYKYQMYSATAVSLNPAAELGDGVTAGGVYSVISRMDDAGGYPDVEAPGKTELEDEYPTDGPFTQSFNRKIAETHSSITKTAEEIRLAVERGDKANASLISQTATEIRQEVTAEFGRVSGELSLKVGRDENDQIVSMLNASADVINLKGNRITIDSTNFDVTEDGTIMAKAGTIGGWNMSANRLYCGASGQYTYLQAPTGNQSYVIAAGGTSLDDMSTAPFRVTKDGKLYATGADITGKITATSGSFTGSVEAKEGQLGGWTIDSYRIYGGDSGTTYSVMAVPSAGRTWVFAAGAASDANLANAPFRVSKAGALYATNADISGTISSTSGNIGGWELKNGAIYYRTASMTSTYAGTYLGTDGIRQYAGSGKYVNIQDGVLTAVGAKISGELTATTGRIGGWDITDSWIYGSADGTENGKEVTRYSILQKPGNYTWVLALGATSKSNLATAPFRVSKAGAVYCTDVVIGNKTGTSNVEIQGTVGGGAEYKSPDITGTVGGNASYTAPNINGGQLNGTGGSYYGGHMGGLLSNCDLGGTSLFLNGSGSALSLVDGSASLTGSGNASLRAQRNIISISYRAYTDVDFYAYGSIDCHGTKSRSMTTKNYGVRQLDAYETPLPTFSDYGAARIDEYGKCYITIDPIFSETVNMDFLPVVFLTKYGEGDIWVESISDGVTVVSGTPGLRFAWETRYAQANNQTDRLRVKEFDQPAITEPDYAQEADADLELDTIDYAQRAYEYYTNFERSIMA